MAGTGDHQIPALDLKLLYRLDQRSALVHDVGDLIGFRALAIGTVVRRDDNLDDHTLELWEPLLQAMNIVLGAVELEWVVAISKIDDEIETDGERRPCRRETADMGACQAQQRGESRLES